MWVTWVANKILKSTSYENFFILFNETNQILAIRFLGNELGIACEKVFGNPFKNNNRKKKEK